MKKTYIYPISLACFVAAQHMLCASSEPEMPSTTILNTAASFSGAAPQRLGKNYL